MLAVLTVPPGDGDGCDGDADGLGDGGADGLGDGLGDGFVGLAGGLAVGFFETARCAPMIRWPTTS
jgi:hypothetical protein